MSIHYKFKSSLDYDTVTFDGLHISVGDLKKCIIQQKKLGKGLDFDLQITNAQTKEVYQDDESLIPKNTSVIVARIPISGASKKLWERNDGSPLIAAKSIEASSEGISFDKLAKTADLTTVNAPEDEKIRAMMTQSTQDYDPSKYVKTKGMTGPLPPNYLCYRCGKPGHWIKNCPTNTLEIKRSTGIPRSFMVTVDSPDVPGALLTSTGHFAVPILDHQAYREGKKEKPPFAKETSPEKDMKPEIPEELLCMICRDLLSDAVLIPCCGNSYCDECVRQALLDSDDHECPTCHEKDISPDNLIPNRFLRTAVINFKNETGYTKVKKVSPILPPCDVVKEVVEPCSKPQNVQPTPLQEQQAISTSDSISTQSSLATSSNIILQDDRPGTPVRDEHPVDISMRGISPNQYPNVSHDDPVAAQAQASLPSTHDHSQPGIAIATIMTRTSRSSFPNHPSLPFNQKRPRGTTHPSASSVASLHRGSTQKGRRYSPSHDQRYQSHSMNSSVDSYSQHHPSYRLPPSTHSTVSSHLHSTTISQSMAPTTHGYSAASVLPPRNMLPRSLPPRALPPRSIPPRNVPPRGPPPSGFPNQPPPPGAVPVNSIAMAQPPPPGIGLPLPPPHHGPPHVGSYGMRHTSNQPPRDRSKNPLVDFERELLEYKRDQRLRRTSRSSSRTYSSSRSSSPSRSRSRSVSRSDSHSSRSLSRSRSYSYSRSRSISSSRSRSRSHSRSRSPYRRSRTRSRSRGRHFISPPYRRSRSRSPYARSRSPYRRDYSPSYYNQMYRYQSVPTTYSPEGRGRYYHSSYRYDDYQYGENRYNSADSHYNSRYDYNKFDNPFRGGAGHDKRSWTPDQHEKIHRDSHSRPEVVHRDRKSHSPLVSKEKELEKKYQKRHHKTKIKKEGDNRSNKENKTKRTDASYKSSSEMSKPDFKNWERPYDTSKKFKSNKKAEKQSESEADNKIKEKKHKAKLKTKIQEQLKTKVKNEKKVVEGEMTTTMKDQGIPVNFQVPKISKKRMQMHTMKRQRNNMMADDKIMEESGMHVNPNNIIVIQTDPDLEIKHQVKEADSTNTVSIDDNTDTNLPIRQQQCPVNISICPTEFSDTEKEALYQVAEPDSASELPEAHLHKQEETKTNENDFEETPVEEVLPEDEEDNNEKSEENAEPVLTAQIPELSKWERDDSDNSEPISPQREMKHLIPKQKKSLPPDIVQRAEKALLQKSMKPTMLATENPKVNPKVVEKKAKVQDKASPKNKPVVGMESREASTLQITISGKDKRSVEAKDSSVAKEKKEIDDHSLKKGKEKIKLDRSRIFEKPRDDSPVSRQTKEKLNWKNNSPNRNFPSPHRYENFYEKKEKSSRTEMISYRDKIDERKMSDKYQGSPRKSYEINSSTFRGMKKGDTLRRSRERDVSKNYMNKSDHDIQPVKSLEKYAQDKRLKYRDHYKLSKDEELRLKIEANRDYEREREAMYEKSRSKDGSYLVERSSLAHPQSDTDPRLMSKDELKHEREKIVKQYSREIDAKSIKEKPSKIMSRKISKSVLPTVKQSRGITVEFAKKKPSKYIKMEHSSLSRNVEKNVRHISGKSAFSSEESQENTAPEIAIPRMERRKSTIDESKFEPDYDGISDSECGSRDSASDTFSKETVLHKRSSSRSPDREKKKQKVKPSHEMQKATPLTLPEDSVECGFPDAKLGPKLGYQKEDKDLSSDSDGSGSDSSADSETKKLAVKRKDDETETHPIKEKHKHKKSKHKKHKKHKHKHKKKKSHKAKHKDDSKVKSTVIKS